MIHMAKTEVKKIAQEAILEGIEKQKELGNDLNQLVKVEKKQNGETSFIQIDSKVQADIYTHAVSGIYKKLKQLKDRPIEISLGQIWQSELFADHGPYIPLEIWPKGAPKVTLIPKSESQGINMVMVTLNMHVRVEMGVLVPFSEEVMTVESEYPIVQALLVGDVPQYYFYNGANGEKKGGTPSPMLPPPAPAQPSLKQKEK